MAASGIRRWLLATPGLAWLPVVMVFGGLIAGLYVYSPTQAPRSTTAMVPELTVREVRPRSVRVDLPSQGVARSTHRVPLVMQAGGEVVEIDAGFRSGARVEAGQALAQLDPEPFELDIAQYEHQVSAARLHLEEVRANAVVARRNASAQATDFALFKPQVHEAESRLAAARASLKMARRHLRQSALEAPFSGRLTEVSVSPGQQVAAGEVLGFLYSGTEVRLPVHDDWLQLLESDLDHQRPALDIPVRLTGRFGGRERVWKARITRREGGLNRNQMSWLIAEVQLQPGDLPLEPGVYVEAEIRGSMLENVYVLPRSALVDRHTVWVVDEAQRLRRRTVEWHYRDGEQVYVSAGLSPGEQVLEQGHRHLLEGVQVKGVRAGGSLEPSLAGSPR